MIEKGIITFKRNSRLTFIDSLRNCWHSTAVHKCDAIIRFSKSEFTQYPFFVRFCPFFTFLLFHLHLLRSIFALTRQLHTGHSFPKKFFCKEVQLYFEISLLSFMHKIVEQNFYLYTTVYLVQIWTYKNADEKAHTFWRRSKNVKKTDKNGQKNGYCVSSP